MDTPTVPAPTDCFDEPPPSARVTPLARAALELGVEADDVLAYLVGRGEHRRSADRLAEA